MLMSVFVISIVISLALILINSLLGEKMFFSREMNSSFECGFDPKSMSRLPFSLHFFLIALIFLIFDVEITLIIPIPLVFKSNLALSMELVMLIFIFILVVGLMVEWKKGALEWSF